MNALSASYVVHEDERTFVAVEDDNGYIVAAKNVDETDPGLLAENGTEALDADLDGQVAQWLSEELFYGRACEVGAYFEFDA